jgi:Fic family protein
MKYLDTHPWLTFEVDLRKAPFDLWLALGEAQSKCEHIAGVPLSPEDSESLHAVYLAKGVWATTAIEGNTLSEEEVRQRIDGKLPLPPSREYLGQEVDNIVAACNQIFASAVDSDSTDITVEAIRQYNRMVLTGLQVEPEVDPGRFRHHSVGVANYRGAPAEECPQLLQRLCEWLNGPGFVPGGPNPIAFGILRAILAHLYLVWIHPFADGNGRTARLLEVQILVGVGVPSPAAHLLSNHYNLTRQEYYKQLDYASRSGGNVVPFIEYAVKGLVAGLRDQVERIRYSQWDVSWRQHIYTVFGSNPTEADKRRRDLLVELSARYEPVPFQRLRDLSVPVARSYIGVSDRTLYRDLDLLETRGLIVRGPDGVMPKRETILAFLPARRT